MGQALADSFAEARQVFEEVDEALSFNLFRLMTSDDAATLTKTENAQPAIMAVGIAALRVLEQQTGFDVAKQVRFSAGHSLGEYTALCAAGVLSLSDTARLLQIRGRAMQAAVPEGQGGMQAVLGLDKDTIAPLIEQASQDGICCLANDNAPGQLVVSGEILAMEKLGQLCKDAGAKKVVPLNVSAPFHSPLMQPAAEIMAEALGKVGFEAPMMPIINNVTATAESGPDALRQLLVDQVTGQVLWSDSVRFAVANGATQQLECGHGKVLSGLAKRIDRSLPSQAVGTPQDIEAFASQQAA